MFKSNKFILIEFFFLSLFFSTSLVHASEIFSERLKDAVSILESESLNPSTRLAATEELKQLSEDPKANQNDLVTISDALIRFAYNEIEAAKTVATIAKKLPYSEKNLVIASLDYFNILPQDPQVAAEWSKIILRAAFSPLNEESELVFKEEISDFTAHFMWNLRARNSSRYMSQLSQFLLQDSSLSNLLLKSARGDFSSTVHESALLILSALEGLSKNEIQILESALESPIREIRFLAANGLMLQGSKDTRVIAHIKDIFERQASYGDRNIEFLDIARRSILLSKPLMKAKLPKILLLKWAASELTEKCSTYLAKVSGAPKKPLGWF